MGTILLAKRDPAGARNYYNAALAIDPTFTEAIGGLSALDVASRNAEGATKRIETAVASSPKSEETLMMAARFYGATGNYSSAEQSLRQAVDANPANLQAYQMLGQLYLSQRKLDDAKKEYEALAERDPSSVTAPTLVGMILEAQNNPAEARTRYERVLERNPNAAVAANNLAWIMSESGGNLDLALQHAQTAKAAMPNRPEVSDTLGWIYYKKNMPSQAIAALTDSAGRDPKNPLFFYHLGMAHAKAGNKEKARVALEKALSLRSDFPGSDEARETLQTLKN
jgi:tetratricopeptide (TPR) repeat protein